MRINVIVLHFGKNTVDGSTSGRLVTYIGQTAAVIPKVISSKPCYTCMECILKHIHCCLASFIIFGHKLQITANIYGALEILHGP